MVCLCPCKFLASLRTSLQIIGPDFNEHSYDDDYGEANRIPKFLLHYIVVSKLLLLLHKLHLLYTTTKKIASIFAKFMTYMMT